MVKKCMEKASQEVERFTFAILAQIVLERGNYFSKKI
jgi:hypothetical protein